MMELWDLRLDSGESVALTVTIGVAGLEAAMRSAEALVARLVSTGISTPSLRAPVRNAG